MSIQPPSDIVLDVALAADPTKRAAAVQKLAASADEISGERFAATMRDTQSTFRANAMRPTIASNTATKTPPQSDAASKAIQSLETFFLRQAFETMLPKSSHVKGFAGAGAEVWKSMMADALANQVEATGGLGIVTRRNSA